MLSKSQNYMSYSHSISKRQSKLSKGLSKGFERSVYWNEYKTKIENKNTKNEYRYCRKSKFIGVNRLFALVYSNRDNYLERFKGQRHYLPRGIIKNYNVIINKKRLLWRTH